MKKKISLAALLIMLLSMAFSAIASAESFTDINDSKYREAIITLSKLNVINGYEESDGTNTFRPDNTITRAEFTKMLVCMMGYEDKPVYNSAPFNDIDMWAKNFINTAYSLGIINGMSDEEFMPDDPVTYEQAQKMMVCALGYVDTAESKGGWPNGYTQTAASLKLKDHISGTSDKDAAPRGVIAQLMYNSLEVKLMEYQNAQWIPTEKTFLTDYLNVVKLKGTLVGVEDFVSSECTVKLANRQMDIMNASGEEIIIDFSDYTKNVTDLNKFLGNIITVYYRLDKLSDHKTLIAIDDETTKNTEFEVNFDKIISYNGTTLVYDENGKKKSIKVSTKNASVRYNGKPISTDTITLGNNDYSLSEAVEQWLSPDSEHFIYGDVKLTDSGSDGDINLIQIYNYETIVAYQAPKTSDYKITDKLVSGRSIILDPNSSEYSYTVQKNGSQIELTAIAAGDVVLYAKSLDGSLYTVYVTSKPVKGSISTTEEGYMYIGTDKYKIGSMCEDYINKNQSGKSIKVGASGTFYLDMYNTVVYGTIDTATENRPYAYIANAFVEEGEDAGYITLYTNGTAAKTYKLKDKVRLNGSTMDYDAAVERLEQSAKYNNADAEESMAQAIYGSDKPNITSCSQVARVTISNNLVTSIVTLDAETTGTQNESTDTIVKYSDLAQYIFSASGGTASTKKGSFKTLGSTTSSTVFSTDSSTTVIFVPKDRKDKNGYASKNFTNNTKYYVEAYDLKSSKIAGLVLVYSNKDNSVTEVSRATNFGIVSALPSSSYNTETDESAQEISVYYGPGNDAQTTVKSWQTLTETEFSDIVVGDVIQFAYDTSKRVKDRINNIKFKDIAAVLDGNVQNDGKLYDWNEEQEPTEENNYQSYKFDYRYKTLDAGGKPSWNADANQYRDEIYTSSSVSTIYSRACMYNVSQVFEDEKKLYVTKNGFDSEGNVDDTDYEEVEITSSTKIIRMESNREALSKYAEDTTTEMAFTDLKSAQYYGKDCSKILVCSSKGVAKLIVVYN
ncbi:MAG: S-layer homology domain-containing protein [Clostridia bacterium]